MKSKRRISLIALLVLFLSGLLWLLAAAPDPLFHGKPESYWIERLSDGRWSKAQDQVEQWREFGPEGVRVLIRASDRADRPLERTYRTAWRKMGSLLPRDLTRLLPSPRSDSTRLTRESVTDLLWRLGNDARIAMRVMAGALKDEDPIVRLNAIRFFTCGGDSNENNLLNQMGENERRKLLHDFIRAIQEREGLDTWYHAAVALGYFPEEREVVAPVLVNALLRLGLRTVPVQDWTHSIPDMGAASAGVWCAARESLKRIAPGALTKAGVVPLLAQVMEDPANEVALAAELLGELRTRPALAVPALIKSLESTNTIMASAAAQTLAKFEEEACRIVPALQRAAQRKDSVGGCAQAALKQLESELAAKPGALK